MDRRQALAPGTVLRFRIDTGYVPYTINGEIGRGGSCIVYDASYADRLGNRKLVRVKECYPHAMRIARDADGRLNVDPRDHAAFGQARERMTTAYQRNHALFSLDGLTNAVANTVDLCEANGTVYIVSVFLNGRTFREYQGETLRDCVSLVLSTARVLERVHKAGYLYLDLKPDNILTVEGSHDLVQLFDFDSTVSMEELSEALRSGDRSILRASYTRGYAPLEQQTGDLRHLGRHTDLYSLGAVLFYALWHRTPTAFDCEPGAAFDYPGMVYPCERYPDRLFRALSGFFRKTLASYHGDRFGDAGEAVVRLREILALSDETRPWLRSSVIPKPPVFYGREAESKDLERLIRENERGVVVLYGMGGIGKSTLVRRYLSLNADVWDAVLWLYGHDRLKEALADDSQVFINTVSRAEEETAEEYLDRKLRALSLLARGRRVLLIIDDLTGAQPPFLQELSRTGVTVLLISRAPFPEGLYPALRLEEMEEAGLAALFAHYSHHSLSDEEDRRRFRAIAETIGRHTLLTELIARQVARSRLDLAAAEAMVCGSGLADLPKDRIDHVRDQQVHSDTLFVILDRLLETDRFPERDRLCVKLLSLFDMPGVEAGLFRWMASLPSMEAVSDLEASGWLKSEGERLYLHPVMREYVRAWPWEDAMILSADRMMRRLYDRIRPVGRRHDGSKQYPADREGLTRLLWTADQLVSNTGWVSEASRRLLFRLLMDAPVDQDASVMFRMLELLEDPRYLDPDSVLRLYENAAYLRARLYAPEEAVRLLGEMKRYLLKHPSAYYLSAYHRAMAVILHNADGDGNLDRCLRHEDRAIAAARLSAHPDAGKQMAGSLLNKAVTLLSADLDRPQARRLILEAGTLAERYAGPSGEEAYQYACTAAMCAAMDGDPALAEAHLKRADAIVDAYPDSDMAAAEHLIEQTAPIRVAMGMYGEAAKAVLRAIALCEKHPEAVRYREVRFDALLFLGRIYAMGGEYGKAETAFETAEACVADSPLVWKLPLCPEDVRRKAEEERRH